MQEDKLGGYVYALVDPRDNSVFYIGLAGGIEAKGNNRPDNHLSETALKIKKNEPLKDKNDRIKNIWSDGKDPELIIVRRNIGRAEAIHVEAALIDLLNHIKPNVDGISLTNNQRGHGIENHSMVTEENRATVIAEKVRPSLEILNVWLFPIKNGLKDHGAAYDAIRGDWRIRKKSRSDEDYAVGLENGISKVVIKIEKWNETGIRDDSKQSFQGVMIHNEEIGMQLFEKDFSGIVNNLGYWKRGNPIKVSFLSSNKVEIVRGLKKAK